MSDIPPDEAFRREQAREYGTYVANTTIFIGTARAFNVGDPVPVSHVERGVVSLEDVDKVAAVATEPVKAEKATTTEPKG